MAIINTVIKGGGVTPTGTISITANGTGIDVTNYASANVNVPTTAPARYLAYELDLSGKLIHSLTESTVMDFTGVQDIDSQLLYYAYAGNTAISGALSFPSLTALSGGSAMDHAFHGCTGLTSVSFPSLTALSGSNAMYHAFSDCTGLTSVSFPALTTVNNGFNTSFQNCTNLTTVDLSALTSITGYYGAVSCFGGCSRLTNIDLSALTTLSGGSCMQGFFKNCTSLTSLLFPALTTISGSTGFASCFDGCSALSTVSFPVLNVISSALCASYTQAFSDCRALSSVSFGGLKASTFASSVNQLQYLFNSTTGSTATGGCVVHFPSNFDPSSATKTFDASTLSGYPTFGGSSSYISVAFDLPATE